MAARLDVTSYCSTRAPSPGASEGKREENSHLHDTQHHKHPPSWRTPVPFPVAPALVWCLRPLWYLMASPTHGQRGHEQEGP